MSMAASGAPRPITDLSLSERDRLERAHQRLRGAVEAYEQFRGGPLEPGQDVPVHDADAMAAAQAEIQAAEEDLWRLREELLGWSRPAWAPPASLVSDWFSEEDRVYDDYPSVSAT